MGAFIYAILAGIGIGALTDDKKEQETAPVFGPLEYEDWVDRTTWYNPIRNTNVDQYVIGSVVLGSLYFLGKKVKLI